MRVVLRGLEREHFLDYEYPNLSMGSSSGFCGEVLAVPPGMVHTHRSAPARSRNQFQQQSPAYSVIIIHTQPL